MHSSVWCFPSACGRASNAAVTDAVYVEARVGGYLSDFVATFKSTDPRIADIGANRVRGGSVSRERLINRPQASGSISFLKTGGAAVTPSESAAST